MVNNKIEGALESGFVLNLSIAACWLRDIGWSLWASLKCKKYLALFRSFCGCLRVGRGRRDSKKSC